MRKFLVLLWAASHAIAEERNIGATCASCGGFGEIADSFSMLQVARNTGHIKLQMPQNHRMDDHGCILATPFKFCNRSLGLQHHRVGRCAHASGKAMPVLADAGSEANFSFEYTPNRKRANNEPNASAQAAEDNTSITVVKGVIVVHLGRADHSRLTEYIAEFGDEWHSWDEHLLTKSHNPHLAVMFVIQSFTPEQDTISLQALQKTTGIAPLVVERTEGYFSDQLQLFDAQGRTHTYSLFTSMAAGRLVIATFDAYPDFTNSEIEAHHAVMNFSPSYIYGTNWYVFGMLKLPIMDFFDAWFKIDLDITILSMMPDLLGFLFDHSGGREGDSKVVFMHTGYRYDADWAVAGVKSWINAALNAESHRCFNKSSVFKCKDPVQCENVRKVPYSNFVGGAMSFWQSPELMRLASTYEAFPDGMWQHRWTDQQWFPNVLALFFSAEEQEMVVKDESSLRDNRFRHK